MSDPTPTSPLETAYLNLFRVAVLIAMSLSLLAVLVLIPWGVYQMVQSPQPVQPAKVAPRQSIDAEAVIKLLIDEEARRRDAQRREEQRLRTGAREAITADEARTTLKYAVQANELLTCGDEFRAATEESHGEPMTDEERARTLAKLNGKLEELAGGPHRGAVWVDAGKSFTCVLLRSAQLQALKKEGKVGSVFLTSLYAHAQLWSKLEQQRIDFEVAERRRVAREEDAEAQRIAALKARGLQMLGGAAAAFGLFLFLALYLIFARIERNLLGVRSAIVAAVQREPSTTG